MASFSVEWKRSATKELKRLPREVILRVLSAVESLSSNPHPPGARKLTGSDHTYRIRIGDYRVVYTVLSSILLVEVIRVGHRKDVYQQ